MVKPKQKPKKKPRTLNRLMRIAALIITIGMTVLFGLGVRSFFVVPPQAKKEAEEIERMLREQQEAEAERKRLLQEEMDGAPGSPGQPRRMDSLSEPSRPTSFTSVEKRGVGVRVLVAGPTMGRPNQECLPQGDLVPRLRHVSLASDERSAWQ